MVVHLTSSHEFYYENGFCSVFSDILYKNIIACMETMLCNYKCTSTLSFFGISEEKPYSVYTETMWCKFMCMGQTKRLCHSSTVYILCGSEISTSIVLMSVQPTSIRFTSNSVAWDTMQFQNSPHTRIWSADWCLEAQITLRGFKKCYETCQPVQKAMGN